MPSLDFGAISKLWLFSVPEFNGHDWAARAVGEAARPELLVLRFNPELCFGVRARGDDNFHELVGESK